MPEKPYEIAQVLRAHTSDVRHLCAPRKSLPLLLSASRDGTAILWGPRSSTGHWESQFRVEGPEGKYVSCVGMVNHGGEAYLLIGSSNGVLSTFTLPSPTSPPPAPGTSPEAYHTLIEHEQNLCCLDTSSAGLIATGSWDKSVVIWKDFKPTIKIQAHDQSIWAVKFIGEDKLLTASADGKIKLHSLDLGAGRSKISRTYEGHTQPVRGLSLTTDGKGFWSCANDSLVNLYTFDNPQPHQSLSGHTSFVYSITALPDGSGAISSGEDGTLRVWSTSDLVQTISHSATSIWSTACVSTGKGSGYYIASAANDGNIRFFSREEALIGDEGLREEWNKEVAARQLDKSQVGDVKHSDLPGMEALGREGKKDGQVIMIKNNDKVEAYQWSQPSSTWQQIGQVVDAVGSGRRQLHEGQEYDYVFDVDVSEGMPPLKLPYNVSENPWFAAQRFLTKHDLPESYAEQVVEFIHKNTAGETLGGGEANTYVDPFTGGSRYSGTPNTGAGGSSSMGGGDPFTGGSSYSTVPPPNRPSTSATILPVTSYLFFKQMNIAAAKSKITSLNAELKLTSSEDEENLNKIYTFLTLPPGELPSVDSESIGKGEDFDGSALLNLTSKWPETQRFPLLDITRCLTALSPYFSTTPTLTSCLLDLCNWGKPISGDKQKETNTLLALRGISNLFATKSGRKALSQDAKSLLERLKGGVWAEGGKWKMPAATVALNYSIMGVKGELDSSNGPTLLDFINHILENEKGDNETIYRAAIALGNILSSSSLSGGLSVGAVQRGKDLVRERAGKLGEKRLIDLASELDRLGA